MPHKPFKVIDGGGRPEADDKLVETLRDLLARAEAGEFDGVFLALSTHDSRAEVVIRTDDPVGFLAWNEEVARRAKAEALGL